MVGERGWDRGSLKDIGEVGERSLRDKRYSQRDGQNERQRKKERERDNWTETEADKLD